MDRIQQVLDRAVRDGVAPGFCGIIGTAERVLWEGAAGEITPDTPLRLYSMSKLVGAVGASILADRGLLDWGAPVGNVLPEFDALPVLEENRHDGPVLREQRARATFADLARHTSGSAYALWQPKLMRYFQETGQPVPESGSATSWQAPLAFDPGQGWAYGFGADWLGLAVQRISGRTLPDFFQTEVFDPLGLASITFLASDVAETLPPAYRRKPEGSIAPFPAMPPVEPEIYGMGNALFGSSRDYFKLLQEVLSEGPLLSKVAKGSLLASATSPLPPMVPVTWPAAEFNLGVPLTHTLGAMRVEHDLPGRRRAGSIHWAGLLNSHYWVDPTSRLTGVFATQVLPFAEPSIIGCLKQFETEVYDAFG